MSYFCKIEKLTIGSQYQMEQLLHLGVIGVNALRICITTTPPPPTPPPNPHPTIYHPHHPTPNDQPQND